MQNSNNKRLAKNTLLLYARTIVVMFISLYVSRLILNALGVSDYGVYNAVGGIVGMFALVSSSLVAATQRFISYELGKQEGNISFVFSLSMGIHLLIGIVILILGESLGTWFLNNYMNIPLDRLSASNWVFQFSIIAFVLQIVTIPYNAIVVAHERMGFFALVSIVEVIEKLLFAFILLVSFSDKLVLYAVSMAIVSLSTLAIYFYYCRAKFKSNCRLQFITEIGAYRQMGSFVGWNFIGSSATVLSKQGVNVILNIFCGVIVNAGRGIATQVDNAVNQFIGSFTTAIRPQITKTYAAQQYDECFRLINQGTKLVIYLSFLFVVPLLFRTDYILTLWLKTVPDYAVTFTQLSFLVIMLDALSTPLYYLMLATGEIKNYQLVAGTLGFLTFPLAWVGLKFGMEPVIVYYVLIIADIFRWIFQLYFLRRIANFDVPQYIRKSMLPILSVTTISFLVSAGINTLLSQTFYGLISFVILVSVVLCFTIYSIGLTSNERKVILSIIKSKFAKQ